MSGVSGVSMLEPCSPEVPVMVCSSHRSASNKSGKIALTRSSPAVQTVGSAAVLPAPELVLQLSGLLAGDAAELRFRSVCCQSVPRRPVWELTGFWKMSTAPNYKHNSFEQDDDQVRPRPKWAAEAEQVEALPLQRSPWKLHLGRPTQLQAERKVKRRFPQGQQPR